MIEAFDVDLLAEPVARLVRFLQRLVLVRRHVVVAIQVRIRADADVLDADQLHDVIDVIDDVLDRGRLLAAHEHAHAGDAHHAALRRELADSLVGLEPRMVVERSTVRVRDRDRLRRELDRVQRRAVAAMRDIDEHADFVHGLDDLLAEIADAAVHAVRAPRAEQVLAVVSQLRAALPQLVELLDVARRAEVLRILHAHDDGNLALLLRSIEIRRRADEREHVRVATGIALPRRNERQRFFHRLRAAGADGIVKRRDPAGTKVRGHLLADRAGVRFRREVDLERRKHVDHERAFDDLHRACRIARRIRAERAVTADVEHRQAEGRDAGRDCSLQHAPAGQELGMRFGHDASLLFFVAES